MSISTAKKMSVMWFIFGLCSTGSVATELVPSNGVLLDNTDQKIRAFISERTLSEDQKLALNLYAGFLQAILTEKDFDELKQIACTIKLASDRDDNYHKAEALIKGKILNSVEKNKKYAAHEKKWSGRMLSLQKVTRAECVF